MKTSKTRQRIPAILVVVLLVVMAAAVVWPLFSHGFFISDDGDWMVIRLSAFFQSLRQGQFPVRYLSRLNFNYGYPVADFLYPGFLYIGSALHLLGLTYTGAVKAILAGSFIGTAVVVYLWLRRNFRPLAAFLGSLSVIFTPYVSYDIFKRGSVGETLAVFAASVLMYGLDGGPAVLVPFATAFLIVSHNSLALMFMAFFALFVIAERRWRYVPYVVLGMVMSAFFWLPALYDRRYIIFDTVSVSDPFRYFAAGARLQLISIAKFIGLAALLVLLTRKRGKRRFPSFFIAAFLVMLFFATPLSAPVWNIASFARLVQFPYRFLALELLAGAWILAAVLDRVRFRTVVFAALTLILAVQWWVTRPPVVTVVRPEGYYSTNEATTTVADEYMPKWARTRPTVRADTKLEFVEGSGKITPVYPGTDKIYFELYSETGGTLRINKVYFPGWGVTVDKLPVPIDYSNDRGVMEFEIPAGSHRVQADFRETPGRFLVDLVSAVGIGVWLALVSRTVFAGVKGKGRT